MEGVAAVTERAERLGYRPELDGLRGVAVLLVLGLHWWPTRLPGGRIGVDLFFVLSGFLITTLMLEEGRVDLRRFWTRRARRLMPAVAVLLAVFWWADGAGWVALYVGNWARVAGDLSPYLAHAWSLGIEEQFYLLWPLAYLGLRRFPRPAVALLLAATAVGVGWWRVSLDAPWERLVNGTDTRLDGLAIGCAVAFGWPWLRSLPWRLAALPCLVGLGAVAVADADLLGWGYTLVSLGWAVVLLAVLDGNGRTVLSRRGLVRVGVLSYSLYLWHYPITVGLRGGDIYDTAAGTTVLAVVATGCAAWASWRWVESPWRSGHRLDVDRASDPRTVATGHAVLHGEGRRARREAGEQDQAAARVTKRRVGADRVVVGR